MGGPMFPDISVFDEHGTCEAKMGYYDEEEYLHCFDEYGSCDFDMAGNPIMCMSTSPETPMGTITNIMTHDEFCMQWGDENGEYERCEVFPSEPCVYGNFMESEAYMQFAPPSDLPLC